MALRDPTILRFLGKLRHADEWASSIEVSAEAEFRENQALASAAVLGFSCRAQAGRARSFAESSGPHMYQSVLVCVSRLCQTRSASTAAGDGCQELELPSTQVMCSLCNEFGFKTNP